MTEREEQYLRSAEMLLQHIQNSPFDNGPKAVCVDALSKHIREMHGWWSEPSVTKSGGKSTIIGLTFADILQLRNGGTIKVTSENLGIPEMDIIIFLGGTDEHMRKGAEKHPGTDFKFFDGHGDTKN